MRGLQYRGLCFVLIARIGKAFFGLFVLPSLFYSLARFGFVCVCVCGDFGYDTHKTIHTEFSKGQL